MRIFTAGLSVGGIVKSGRGCIVGGMTEDQIYRAAAVGVAMPIWAYLIQQTKAYLSARRDKQGRGLIQEAGYRLGKLWARANRATK